MPDQTSFKDRRQEAGFVRQVEAAKALGTHPANVCRWESDRAPTPEWALRFMDQIIHAQALERRLAEIEDQR